MEDELCLAPHTFSLGIYQSWGWGALFQSGPSEVLTKHHLGSVGTRHEKEQLWEKGGLHRTS